MKTIKISKDILQNVGNRDNGIVNVHRTGKNSSNEDKHIIAKVFTNDDKIRIIPKRFYRAKDITYVMTSPNMT